MNIKKTFIVGAGRFGRKVYDIIKENGAGYWNVEGYIDSDETKYGSLINGVKVFSMDSVVEQYDVTDIVVLIAVVNSKDKNLLREKLVECGFANVFVLFKSVCTYRINFINGTDLNPKYVTPVRYNEAGELLPIFQHIETPIMEGCNLKCQGCLHLSSLFPTDTEVSLEQFRKDIIQLSKIASVEFLQLLGGEPLLNKNLLEYLKIAREYHPYANLRIVTNGLLLFNVSDDIFSYMSENDIAFSISWYPPTYSLKDKILALLREKNVRLEDEVKEIKTFFKGLTLEPNSNPDRSMEACISKICTILRHGCLYKCQTAAYMNEFNKKFDTDLKGNEPVSIYTTSIKELREFAKKCQTDTISLCRYCSEKPELFEWKVSAKPEMNEWII